MTSEDPTVDGAVAESAGSADAPEPTPEGGADKAAAEESIEPGSTKDKWRQALDRYLESNLTQALALVDEILAEDPHTDLRPRLERLKRRALDRLEGEGGGAPAPADGGAAALGGGGSAAEAPAEAPPASADPATAEPPPAEPPPPPAETPAAEDVASPSAATPSTATPSTATPSTATPSTATQPAVQAASATPATGRFPVGGEVEAAAAPIEASSDDLVGGEADPETTGEGGSAAATAEAPPASEPVKPLEAAKTPTPPPPRRTTPGPGAILRRPPVSQRRVTVGAPPPAAPSGAPASAPATAVTGSGGSAAAQPGLANGHLVAKELDKVHTSVEQLGKVMRGIESNMVRIAEAYQRVAKDSKRKDQAYDQLYEELRQYKDDWLLNAQKPLFRDVVLLYDSVARMVSHYEGQEGETVSREDVLGSLRHLRDEVLEVLYRRDVERIEDVPPKLAIDFQKPVRRVDTDDPAQDRDVTQVLRDGFRLRGVVLRPQEVVVKRHMAPAASGGNTPAADAPSTEREGQ